MALTFDVALVALSVTVTIIVFGGLELGVVIVNITVVSDFGPIVTGTVVGDLTATDVVVI